VSARSRSPQIGIAIGQHELTAVIRIGATERVERLPLVLSMDEPEPALATALALLAERIAAWHGRPPLDAEVSVALLPPLAETRLVPLPPLRREEAEAVLRRDAARYFIGTGTRALLVGTDPDSSDSAGRPVLATAATIVLVEAVRRAIIAAGWQLDRIAPAHGAWIAAAAAGRTDGAARLIVALHDGTGHVARLENGRPAALRRVPAAAAAELRDAAGPGPGIATLIADDAARPALEAVLRADGWTVAAAPAAGAAELAARHASASLLELLPLTVLAQRQAGKRRLAARLAMAAVLFVVASAGVELWGARRELSAVQQRRAEIRGDVGPLLVVRDSLEQLRVRMDAIDALTTGAPRWTRAFFDIALVLPAETHLTRLIASGDTLEIEAQGARAGAALQALRDVPSLRDVRLVGGVDRQLTDGATALERFRITGRIVPATPAAAAASGGEEGQP
jgi:hypothetical protein